jgi:hypothetical protein
MCICGQPVQPTLVFGRPRAQRSHYCSRICRDRAQRQRQRGAGRPKGSRNEPDDIPEAEIEMRYLQARAQQDYDRRKSQSVYAWG